MELSAISVPLPASISPFSSLILRLPSSPSSSKSKMAPQDFLVSMWQTTQPLLCCSQSTWPPANHLAFMKSGFHLPVRDKSQLQGTFRESNGGGVWPVWHRADIQQAPCPSPGFLTATLARCYGFSGICFLNSEEQVLMLKEAISGLLEEVS